MGLVYSETHSGITRADFGADGDAVRRALRQHDDRLRLLPPGVDAGDGRERRHWRVYLYVAGDRPLEFLLSWQTDRGEPLPLSMALVDEVQRHDRNSRAQIVEAEVANELLRQEKQREFEREKEGALDDWMGPRAEKGRLPVFHKSPALAVARRRGRRRGVSG